MAFVPITDRAAGYALAEADWDAIKDNMNGATWVQLADTTLTGTAAEIEFASLDQAFSHLLIHAYLRGTAGGSGVSIRLRLNSDSGSNYDQQYLQGQAASVTAAEAFANAGFVTVGTAPAAGAGANLFGALKTNIPAYSQATGHKVLMSQFSYKAGTSTTQLQSGSFAGFWRSTTVVSNVKLYPSSGDWAIGSRATLYALA